MRELLELLEQGPDGGVLVGLAWLAGRELEHDEDELRGTVRRAELLLAAGGDPRRELELDGRAVEAVAADLDGEAAREQLEDGLAALVTDSEGLPAVREGLARLRAQPDLAWRCYACALLADAMDGDGDAEA
jgi:hypothetical protein